MTPIRTALRSFAWLAETLVGPAERSHRLRRRTPSTTGALQQRLERLLYENILRFWMPRSLDERHGGYIVGFDPDGQTTDPVTKGIVTQARMLWFFSRLARSPVSATFARRPQLLSAAELGYRFLRQRMWDSEHGGFYWQVDRSGTSVLDSQKHLYGHSFALYALSEYCLLTKREDAIAFATEVFDLLESKAHDKAYGGYIENFARDWSPASSSQPPTPGGGASFKLANTHMHLLEAMIACYEASCLPLVRDRLLELVTIIGHAVIRTGPIACTDIHEKDWTPRLDRKFDRVVYGHDIEIIYLLMEANRVTGLPDHPYLGLYKALFANALRFGYDRRAGGFFASGPLGRLANRREKVWWVQAEALTGSLRLYELTSDPLYWDAFESVLDFVEAYQVDWNLGEWHEHIDRLGRPSGAKAHLWKSAYHNGRAAIECLETLRRLEGSAQGESPRMMN